MPPCVCCNRTVSCADTLPGIDDLLTGDIPDFDDVDADADDDTADFDFEAALRSKPAPPPTDAATAQASPRGVRLGMYMMKHTAYGCDKHIL